MKKFIFAAAAMFMVPTAAQAQSSAVLCPKMGELAGAIMKARQYGIPKYTVLEKIVEGSSHDLAISLVNLAYSTPVYPTERMKSVAIEGFQNQAEYICYQKFTY